MSPDLGRGDRSELSLPIAPSLSPTLDRLSDDEMHVPAPSRTAGRREVLVAGLAMVVALVAALAAQFLMALIGLVTNLAFYGEFSFAVAEGGIHGAPLLILLVPVLGALVVGVLARYGSRAIRGHGIPEVMERVLHGDSEIPARVMLLKPLSAAVAIGTGGPFGAEGPIIATGGAMGSLFGQIAKVTIDERKVLLAAGAAAGMAATFGSPVSAVLLAVELLLFEYRARSLIPVALAASVAAAVRLIFAGSAPIFPTPAVAPAGAWALAVYVLLGACLGLAGALITRFAYQVEDAFDWIGKRFGIHWMWWPALGAVVVGVVGVIEPRTLGVGYDNIVGALDGTIAGRALLMLAVLKFVSWVIYLGSGTSGGTLAPLFTIGGGLGAWSGSLLARFAPGIGVEVATAGLVGMAAIFAGASHALLASVVFAFETTRQPMGLLPILAGASAGYLASLMFAPHSIMTEKLARRGTPVRTGYAVDHLERMLVRDMATYPVVTVSADEPLGEVRTRLSAPARRRGHQAFPVVDQSNRVIGVLTRHDLLDGGQDETTLVRALVKRRPVIAFDDNTLREAADQMVLHHVGRLPVVRRSEPGVLVGILTRTDLLMAHNTRLRAGGARVTETTEEMVAIQPS
ncbi:MAG TPA: chloride channel protein [Gemmatimonadaceae bacterium]|nr:chloride channel protein [Gemmatimonadaceae bacterium]